MKFFKYTKLFLMLLAVGVQVGCKKQAQQYSLATVIKPDTAWFAHSGYQTKCVGDTVRFYSWALPAGATVKWEFGDGYVDREDSTFHVYLTPGKYQVKLTVNDTLQAYSTSPTVVVVNDPVYTHLLNGTHHWTGGNNLVLTNSSTSTALPDTSFNITVLDKVTIQMWGITFAYDPQLSSPGVIAYEGINSALPPYDQHIYFNTSDNSISIQLAQSSYTDDNQPEITIITYHSP